MNRKHLFMFAAGLVMAGLVTLLIITSGSDEPSPEKNPPKKEPAVKTYKIEGLELSIVFEDGCNPNNLKIILKDLEMIVSQVGGG